MAEEKPAHILEISDALGRDVDKAREGKIAPPPIDAFLSDTTLAEIERATKAKDEPVHAENLHPITRGMASARTSFDGSTLPAAPSMRRVIPAPFRRPRINADRHGKTWQWVPATEVSVGEMSADVGQVTDVLEHVVHAPASEYGGSGSTPVAVGTVTVLTGLGGAVKAYRAGAQAQVFRSSE